MVKLYLRAGRAELRCPKAEAEAGHVHVQFVWSAGSEHVEHHHLELQCPCGQLLAHVGGDDPHAAAYVEVEGTPHGA